MNISAILAQKSILAAWTELTRRQHARVGDKYTSDLTDAEWALIEPLMPPLKTTGRPRTKRLRDVFDVIILAPACDHVHTHRTV